MSTDRAFQDHVLAVFRPLNSVAAANAFPKPLTLSVSLGPLVTTVQGQTSSASAKLASHFGTAAVDMWHRAIHSFLVSAGLTGVSPIWASVAGYYSSHYTVRALAHLLGYFLLFTKKRLARLQLAQSGFTCSFHGKTIRDGEHKLYWRLVKQSRPFASNALFTFNDPYASESDVRHRNHANYADHLDGYPQFNPLDAGTLGRRVEFISKIAVVGTPLPRLDEFPDLEYVQLIAYRRLVEFRRILDEMLQGKNRFWDVHRTPPFARGYMNYQLIEGGELLSVPAQ